MPPAHSSPRKPAPSERKRNADESKPKRNPPHCLRCPGPNFPLCVDCLIHSKKAQKCRTNTNLGTPDPNDQPPQLPDFPEPPQLFLDPPQMPQVSPGNNLSPQGMRNFDEEFASGPLFTQSQTDALLNGLNHEQQGFRGHMLGQAAPAPHEFTPTPSSPSIDRPTPELDSSLSPRTPVSSSSPATPSPISRRQYARTYINGTRQRPTFENPVYGFLTAKKGSVDYDVVRSGALLGRVERKKVNQRYVRTMDRILLNCEKLADETDCWLYIAAHHPSSQGEYIHYTSPAMQNDLPPDARDYLYNTSATLFSALKTARRQDVASVELAAAKARAERDVALSDAAQKQGVIDEIYRAIRDQGVTVDLSRLNASPSGVVP
ncbi:hypothetical protein V5O48_017146 [Marasmius crinis-equi]|uniref:Uncharacterized protein n=1 Tax=Marasmius crinis-equi TaxID=585013 RepID=A0ABR3EPT5_9AGAR